MASKLLAPPPESFGQLASLQTLIKTVHVEIGENYKLYNVAPPLVGYLDQITARKYTEGTQSVARQLWSDPATRWLLSTVPSAMIFDDHELAHRPIGPKTFLIAPPLSFLPSARSPGVSIAARFLRKLFTATSWPEPRCIALCTVAKAPLAIGPSVV